MTAWIYAYHIHVSPGGGQKKASDPLMKWSYRGLWVIGAENQIQVSYKISMHNWVSEPSLYFLKYQFNFPLSLPSFSIPLSLSLPLFLSPLPSSLPFFLPFFPPFPFSVPAFLPPFFPPFLCDCCLRQRLAYPRSQLSYIVTVDSEFLILPPLPSVCVIIDMCHHTQVLLMFALNSIFQGGSKT